jgi:hypothetical protein
MQDHSSNTLLSQIDQRRDNIANAARHYLTELKAEFPEIQYLTLNLKHLYGFSSLRVYTKKEDHQTATQNDTMDDPLASPF